MTRISRAVQRLQIQNRRWLPLPKASFPVGKTRTVRRTLADGTTKEYTYGIASKRRHRVAYDANSVGALLLAYEHSPEWRALAEPTRRTYAVYLREVGRLKHIPVAGISRRGLLTIRDAVADARGNGAGTGFARSASALFAWAVSRDWIEINPMAGAKSLPGGSLLAWTEHEARLAMRSLPEPLRRAVVLAYHTGQRRTDLVRLPWSAFDGTTIRLRQQKTGTSLVLPAHPELQAELSRWERTATVILTAPRGAAWTPERLSHALPAALTSIGIIRRLTIHGLRKLAATRLAEAGCSAHEIAAITGHKSLSMVQHYTASADQEKLASAAITRLQQRPRKRSLTG